MSRAYAKRRQKGAGGGLFVAMHHSTMDAPAWRALSLAARCLYLELRRVAGIDMSRNGNVFLSVRDAAVRLGCNRELAGKAFDDLQAKGFIRPREIGRLGIEGKGRATQWLLTELGTSANPTPEKAFLKWALGHDFPVTKGPAPRHKKQNPVRSRQTPCPVVPDDGGEPVRSRQTPCPVSPDDGAVFEPEPVRSRQTYRDLPCGGAQPSEASSATGVAIGTGKALQAAVAGRGQR